MDLETRQINEIMVPYSVSIYDGKITTSFYLSDFKSSDEMLKSAIKTIMKAKYHNYKIYIHNFSYFDVIFLFNTIIELADSVDPIINDGQFINIIFNFGDYKLYFRDSLLMLPSSLRKLAKAFKVEDKGMFPYRFVTEENIKINYNSSIPDYNYFDGITIDQYNDYSKEFINKQWNLKEQTIKYCERDCRVLYKVLEEFFKENYENTMVNASRYVSLPSLAFANYRTKFLSNKKDIVCIKGELFHFLKQGYRGGAVDSKDTFYNLNTFEYRFIFFIFVFYVFSSYYKK